MLNNKLPVQWGQALRETKFVVDYPLNVPPIMYYTITEEVASDVLRYTRPF